METKNKLKVGILVASAIAIIFLFSWLIGGHNPFRMTRTIYVTYHFAGGIEKGSPVRLAGIKVGRVEDIEFITPEESSKLFMINPDSKEAVTPLKIKVTLEKEAADLVRVDSKFYINLAGLIGERYIEITSGSKDAPMVKDGDIIRGIDPPRIDQLISQSFNLAGKIQDVIERNEGDITKTIELIQNLSASLNNTLLQLDKSNFLKSDMKTLVENMVDITNDFKKLSKDGTSVKMKKVLNSMELLLKRAESVDKEAVKTFFQKEGVQVHLF
jgi:phospholipid/cholesterol/gamma-HCH transport system substrate-binding protein